LISGYNAAARSVFADFPGISFIIELD